MTRLPLGNIGSHVEDIWHLVEDSMPEYTLTLPEDIVCARGDRCDAHGQDRNMYGCSPCPHCGSKFRWPRNGDRRVLCDECGFQARMVDVHDDFVPVKLDGPVKGKRFDLVFVDDPMKLALPSEG